MKENSSKWEEEIYIFPEKDRKMATKINIKFGQFFGLEKIAKYKINFYICHYIFPLQRFKNGFKSLKIMNKILARKKHKGLYSFFPRKSGIFFEIGEGTWNI